MFSLPGLSSGVLVSPWLSLSATRRVRVWWCWASRQWESLPLKARGLQLSRWGWSRFSCSYIIPVLIFILEAFSLNFIGRCFSQAWSILGTKRGNPQLVCFSSEKCLFFKGSCLLFHNYLLLFFFFFLSELLQLFFSWWTSTWWLSGAMRNEWVESRRCQAMGKWRGEGI